MQMMQIPPMLASTSKAAVGKKETSERREKSLSLMTQKFITLFMEAKDGVLSLEDAAAAMLMSEGGTDAKSDGDFNEIEVKKKIRRLYDIANILSSLRLLSKIHLMDSRKPAFRWMRAENTVRKLIAAGKSTSGSALPQNVQVRSKTWRVPLRKELVTTLRNCQ